MYAYTCTYCMCVCIRVRTSITSTSRSDRERMGAEGVHQEGHQHLGHTAKASRKVTQNSSLQPPASRPSRGPTASAEPHPSAPPQAIGSQRGGRPGKRETDAMQLTFQQWGGRGRGVSSISTAQPDIFIPVPKSVPRCHSVDTKGFKSKYFKR